LSGIVGKQRRFALKNINELILPRVSMMQRRNGARRQAGQVHSEIVQAEEVAKRTLEPAADARGEGFRIIGDLGARRRFASKQGRAIGHGVPPLIAHPTGAD